MRHTRRVRRNLHALMTFATLLAAFAGQPRGQVVPALDPGRIDHLANADHVLRIERGSQGMVMALVYSNERVRGLRYERQP